MVIIDTLNKEINVAIADDTIKARLADLGGIVMAPNSPAEFAKFVAGVIRAAIRYAEIRRLSPALKTVTDIVGQRP